ncbi:alginate O-acetyltransferase AlgX-related protein [Deinococcus puniceus]|uniref:alginate O-acetyltransferase AlgX-related protein n=1 Tax=Deinococcus puniceus TaxID=1182568 RepID=UPI0018D2E416|nr:hypothetical protein [Deinococcus puniceus]
MIRSRWTRAAQIVLALAPLSLGGALAQAAVSSVQPTYAACAKSSDIDGKGTYELFGSNGWIFESYEFSALEGLRGTSVAALTRLAKAFKARGSTLILVPVPTRAVSADKTLDFARYPQLQFSKDHYVASWNTMIAQARATGITVIDLLPTVLDFQVNARGEDFFQSRDHHWSLSGMEAATTQIAAQISALAQAQKLDLERQQGELTIKPAGGSAGSMGSHYMKACDLKIEAMPVYDATYTAESTSLLDDVEPVIGIFGDSFGLSYSSTRVDKNFGVLLEAKTALPVVNNSVSGNGRTATLAGYLADPALVDKLPPFVVVPFMGGISNSDFDYGQMTAALIGCSDANRIAQTKFSTPAAKMVFAPQPQGASKGNSLIHIHTDAPTNYLEVREGTYTDGSPLKFEIYRTSASYFTGSRTDFYSLLADEKSVRSLAVQLEKQGPVSGYVEVCRIPDALR